MHIPFLTSSLLAIASLTATASSSTTTIFEGRRPFNFSPTHVEYACTVTETKHHDCGTHEAVVVRARGFGHGPMRLITTTVMAPVTTVTSHVCSGKAASAA